MGGKPSCDGREESSRMSSNKTQGGDREGRWRIARRVAKDRTISTVDPEARHGHKTRTSKRDGYKAHVATEPETGLVTAAVLTAANTPDADSIADLVAEEPPGAEIVADSAYASGRPYVGQPDKPPPTNPPLDNYAPTHDQSRRIPRPASREQSPVGQRRNPQHLPELAAVRRTDHRLAHPRESQTCSLPRNHPQPAMAHHQNRSHQPTTPHQPRTRPHHHRLGHQPRLEPQKTGTPPPKNPTTATTDPKHPPQTPQPAPPHPTPPPNTPTQPTHRTR